MDSARPDRPAIVIMGVSGSGKSSVGQSLADRLGISFVDGDDLHPPANVAKMSRGEALDDRDRWPWLSKVGRVLADEVRYASGIAVACSALRRSYRDHIRDTSAGSAPCFVFLDITVDEARARLQRRPGHFMPASLVESQFATLERPTADEADTVRVEEVAVVESTVEAALQAMADQGLIRR